MERIGPTCRRPRRARTPRFRRARWEALWQVNDAIYDPRWRQARQKESLQWTNWPLFTVGLVQRGYSDDEIRKIVGGNILRVMRAVQTLPHLDKVFDRNCEPIVIGGG